MIKTKFGYVLMLLALGFVFVSCDDDDSDDDHMHGDNEITITIEDMLDGSTISRDECDDVHIHVNIKATDETHEIKVILHEEGVTAVDQRIINFDRHEHASEYDFIEDVDLCGFASGTCFHLEVEAYVDHEGNEIERADAEFCIE